jgi:ATP-binding cassette, subfamily B, heavy metal transporter
MPDQTVPPTRPTAHPQPKPGPKPGDFTADMSLARTVKHLWPYVWPENRLDLKLRSCLALSMMLAAKLVTMAVPFSFKWVTDALVDKGAGALTISVLAGPIAFTLLYGTLRAFMQLFTQARDALFAAVSMNAVRLLADKVFVHLHCLSLRFHLERKTGGLTRVLERGREAIAQIVRMSMLTGVPTVVEFSMILGIFVWKFDWRYVVTLVAMIVFYLWFTTWATNRRIAIRRSMNESDSDANTKAIDSLLNYETVKYFGAEEREAARYDKAMQRYEHNSVSSYISLAVLNSGQGVVFSIGLTLVMVMSIMGVRAGTNTLGDLVLVNAMMIQLYQPLNFMGMLYREIRQSVIDIETMFQLLGQNPEISDKPGAPPLAVTAGTVRFEDVHFSYDPARKILRGISFEVPAGKTLAIVGPSGAGKSTIPRLLFRFYEPQSGRIVIDGQDIANVQQRSLRDHLGMVPQDTVLFNDTIAYNIHYGRWDATDEEVRDAARLAQIDTFIRMTPKGYETQVGERGLKLSGGEKQRVAIARTILKSPAILVLDEATSALDSHTEREIQLALDRVSKGRTTLVIAHRLSTVVNADQILVIDKGLVVERGRHEELLARNGVYASMWNRQRQVDAANEALRRAEEEEGESVRVTMQA